MKKENFQNLSNIKESCKTFSQMSAFNDFVKSFGIGFKMIFSSPMACCPENFKDDIKRDPEAKRKYKAGFNRLESIVDRLRSRSSWSVMGDNNNTLTRDMLRQEMQEEFDDVLRHYQDYATPNTSGKKVAEAIVSGIKTYIRVVKIKEGRTPIIRSTNN